MSEYVTSTRYTCTEWYRFKIMLWIIVTTLDGFVSGRCADAWTKRRGHLLTTYLQTTNHECDVRVCMARLFIGCGFNFSEAFAPILFYLFTRKICVAKQQQQQITNGIFGHSISEFRTRNRLILFCCLLNVNLKIIVSFNKNFLSIINRKSINFKLNVCPVYLSRPVPE